MRYTIYSMISFSKNQLFSQAARIAIYGVFFWMIFLLVRSIWQNWSLRQSISKLNDQIVTLEKDKNDLNNLILYYRSDSFKELEARKKLGMKRPDEKMVILPVLPNSSSSPAAAGQSESLPGNFSEEVKKEQEILNSSGENSPVSNWQLWRQYFTK